MSLLGGILGGSGGVPQSPAMQDFLAASQQKIQNWQNTWFPLQSYFAAQNQANAPALTHMMRGQAAGGAEAKGAGLLQGTEGTLAGTGSEPGSGRLLSGITNDINATATAKSGGLTGASAMGSRNYIQGVLQALGGFQSDENQALGSLGQAANLEQGEAGAYEQRRTGEEAGIAGLLGKGAGLLMSGGVSGGAPS